MFLLGCGRLGFDALGGDDGPPGGVDLDFRSCASPASGIAFARASTATYFDATGTMQTAEAGQPRCSYDANGKPSGLLVEGAAINRNAYSRGEGVDVENLPEGWISQHDVPVTVSATVASSTTFLGMREATLTVTNSDNVGQYWQVLTGCDVPQGGGPYTMSWYVRSTDPAGIQACYMFGLLFTPNLQMTLLRTPESPDVIPGAAWGRIVYTINAPPTTGHIQMYFECVADASTSFSLTLAAPQLEQGPLATTPIPTTGGTTAMRAADIVTLSTSQLNIDESGTVVVDVGVADAVTDVRRTALASGDTATVFRLAREATGWTASNDGSVASVPGVVAGTHRVGYRFAPGAGTLAVDGVVNASPGAPALAGSLTALGADRDGVDSLTGTLARVRAWPDALDDTTLMSVTQSN
jgi:hypothetical protein